MKTLMIYLLTLISITIYAKDEGLITGTVKIKSSGVPVAGAKIALMDQNITTYTDQNGKYHVEKLPQGVYRLKCFKPFYEDVVKMNINVKKDSISEVNFLLKLISISPSNQIVVDMRNKKVYTTSPYKIIVITPDENIDEKMVTVIPGMDQGEILIYDPEKKDTTSIKIDTKK